MARRRRHRRIDHGNIHTATIFPARLAGAARQESVSQVQNIDGRSGALAGSNYRRRRLWNLVFNPCNQRLNTSCALDTTGTRTYSLPFRTKRLETNKQRPVGSVGVEALLDRRAIRSLTIIVA